MPRWGCLLGVVLCRDWCYDVCQPFSSGFAGFSAAQLACKNKESKGDGDIWFPFAADGEAGSMENLSFLGVANLPNIAGGTGNFH